MLSGYITEVTALYTYGPVLAAAVVVVAVALAAVAVAAVVVVLVPPDLSRY